MSSLSRTLTSSYTKRGLHSRFDAVDFHLGALELFFMRLGFAILIFLSIKWETGSLGKVDADDAVGLAKFWDLTFFAHLTHVSVWKWLTSLGLAAYAAGRLPVLGLLPALFFAIGIGTLNASQGSHNHSTQLCSMILLAQFLVYALPWMQKKGFKADSWLAPDLEIHRRAFYVTMVVFAASYVVCGWVKLDNSDWHWFHNILTGLSLEIVKTNVSSYYDTLAPVPASLNMILDFMRDHPALAKMFFGAGLLIELCAFLALMGRRWAFFYGLAIIALHLSISRLMQLDFWYHIWAAVIFMLNLPGLVRTFGPRQITSHQ